MLTFEEKVRWLLGRIAIEAVNENWNWLYDWANDLKCDFPERAGYEPYLLSEIELPSDLIILPTDTNEVEE